MMISKGIAETEIAIMSSNAGSADETVPGGLIITADLARMYGGDLVLAESSLGELQASLILPAV